MKTNASEHHVWPVVVAAAGGVGVGIAATVFWTKFCSSARNRDCALPCLLSLLEALQENLERWRLEVRAEKWNEFVAALCRRLHAVKEELARIRGASELEKCLGGVVKVIDQQLVRLLWTEPGVCSVLGSYLPRRPGQTWHDVFQLKSEGEQRLYTLLQREVELVELLRRYIDELSSDLTRSLVPDITRGEEEETPTQAYKIVKVMFATDREVTADAEYVGKMSRLVTRNPVPLQFGWVEVGIPVAREIGTLNAPAKRSFEEADPAKHVVIFSVATELRGNLPRFLIAMNEDLAGRDLLLYIHGYNTSHVKAVKKAAQLKHDLDFQGTILLFSWSSTGTLGGYFADEETIKHAAKSLHMLLKSIAITDVLAPRAHIIAHSMGTRALIGALRCLFAEAGDQRPPLSQVILVAADENRRLFEELVQKANETYAGHGTTGKPRFSVYCSAEDRALALSRRIHGWTYRLGDTRSLLACDLGEHIDVIDTTGVINQGASKYGHSYHLEAPVVIADIGSLLKGRPASDRIGLDVVEDRGKKFYAFNRDRAVAAVSTGCFG